MRTSFSGVVRFALYCMVLLCIPQHLYAMQPYENPNFQVIDQGASPTGVAAWYTIFNYYQDQGTYNNLDGSSSVVLNTSAQVWSWINNSASTVSFDQLNTAASDLSTVNTCAPRYVTEMNTNFTELSDTSTRIARFGYLLTNYLQKNRPVIIHMTPSNYFLSQFYMVLLGYDAANNRVWYACTRDGGYKTWATYNDFITTYFYQNGTSSKARWDGEWSGFYIRTGNYRFSVTVDSAARWYNLHVPDNYTGSTAVPLVLDFHGALQNAAVQQAVSAFWEKSNAEGFLVVYPEGSVFLGTARVWNADLTNTDPNQKHDVAFAAAIVNDLISKNYNIDARRVYVTGLSSGGSMAVRCLYEQPNVFAAASIVSAALLLPTGQYSFLNKRIPLALMQINAFDDYIVSYDGPPSMPAIVAAWALGNGCSSGSNEWTASDPDPNDQNDFRNESIFSYPCACGVKVKLVSLHTSHNWGDDAHNIYGYNFHGTTKYERRQYLTQLQWDYLKLYSRP